VIVRILGEGQFDVPGEALAKLNELDEAVLAAVEADDRLGFDAALAALLDSVRSVAEPHYVEGLETSDVILPAADSTLSEVRDLLGNDGLIPG